MGAKARWALLCAVCFAVGFIGGGCGETPRKQVTVVDGVEVIVNPALPLHKDPGRILKVREKLRIRDTGDTFYFKSPAFPKIAADGSILFMQIGQLLRFSPQGAFLGDLVKLGQGPGEIDRAFGYAVEGDGIYVFGLGDKKAVHMALDGRFLDERRLDNEADTMTRGWFLSALINLPKTRGVLSDATHNFIFASRSDPKIRKTCTLFGKFFIKPPVYFAWDTPHWVADAGRDLVFISLSRDYGIKVLDINAGRVVRSFSRAYPKVRYDFPPQSKTIFVQAGVPKPDFEDEVLDLFLPDGSLWVRTSTADAKKGQLFDVFSAEGDFLDSFYVAVSGKIIGIVGDTIFVAETAADGTIAVVLYENLEYGRD